MLKNRISTLAIMSIIMSISSVSFIHADNIEDTVNTNEQVIEQINSEEVLEVDDIIEINNEGNESNENIIEEEESEVHNGEAKEEINTEQILEDNDTIEINNEGNESNENIIEEEESEVFNSEVKEEDSTIKRGWFLDNGNWYYWDEEYEYTYNNGVYTIDGSIYYFNEDGSMCTDKGWKKKEYYNSNYEWYYLNGDGTVKTGWFLDNGNWYYWDKESGYACANDIYEIDGSIYYFNEDGSMCTDKGWKKKVYYDDYYKWYYLNGDGTCKTGWFLDNDNWYYWDEESGYAFAGDVYEVNDIHYYFNEDGSMCTDSGWKKCIYGDDYYEWYYLNGDGTCKVGWLLDNNKWYYFNEVIDEYEYKYLYMAKASEKINGKMYYFNEDGSMCTDTGWKKHIYNDDYYEWYYLNGDGTCKTGWFLDNGVWYYWDEEYGYAYNDGVYEINGKMYYFNEDGSMCTDKGWKKVEYYDDYYNWYYLNGDGTIKTGWLLDNNNWYYWDEYGYFFKGGNYTIEGIDYIFDENGICVNP